MLDPVQAERGDPDQEGPADQVAQFEFFTLARDRDAPFLDAALENDDLFAAIRVLVCGYDPLAVRRQGVQPAFARSNGFSHTGRADANRDFFWGLSENRWFATACGIDASTCHARPEFAL